MIEEGCFSEKWIQKQRTLLGRADPTLIEKTIYAFELLGQLCENHLNFVFKGGTCLLLILPGFRRLSIDVDIVTQASAGNFAKIFDECIKESPFFRWMEDPRTAIHIPKKHFKFFFIPLSTIERIMYCSMLFMIIMFFQKFSFSPLSSISLRLKRRRW